MRSVVLLFGLIVLGSSAWAAGFVIDHTSITEFDLIPQSYIDTIQSNYHLYYGRASHGRQVHTGLTMIETEDASMAPPFIHGVDVYVDQDGVGDTSWVPDIRAYIAATPACNVVKMAWCAGVARGTEASINVYLAKMEELESDYPDIVFIWETAHRDYWAPVTADANNEQIRQYCIANNKILYDFADIESWDPDGNYYANETDTCNWCITWCASNPCPSCAGCAHSHCFNCYLKGKAFWVMMAAISGWSLAADVDPIEDPELPDDFVLGQNYPNPFNMGTSFEFHVPARSAVTISVYNVLGMKVRTLVDKEFSAGTYRVTWDGFDSNGREVSSGVYFYRLSTGSIVQSRKMLMLK